MNLIFAPALRLILVCALNYGSLSVLWLICIPRSFFDSLCTTVCEILRNAVGNKFAFQRYQLFLLTLYNTPTREGSLDRNTVQILHRN